MNKNELEERMDNVVSQYESIEDFVEADERLKWEEIEEYLLKR